MSISIIHNFKFSSGCILEINFKDVDYENNKYQWYLIYKDVRHDLTLIESNQTSYKFICITYFCVFLDISSNELSIYKNTNDKGGL